MNSRLIFMALPLNVYHSLVVQVSDSSIHRINHCPADKYQESPLRYPVDRDFSSEEHYPPLEQLGLALYYKHYSPFCRIFQYDCVFTCLTLHFSVHLRCENFFVEFVAVHNGIITNYKTLKHFLVSKDMQLQNSSDYYCFHLSLIVLHLQIVTFVLQQFTCKGNGVSLESHTEFILQ